MSKDSFRHLVSYKSSDILPEGKVEVVREFPDTEPFVDADSRLLLTRQGLVVVGRQEVTALRMM